MHPTMIKDFELRYAKELGIDKSLIDDYPKTYRCKCDKYTYNIPRHLMFRMMVNQVKQDNPPNAQVFMDNIYTGKVNGGFDFNLTKEHINWYNFIADYRRYSDE